MVMNTLNLTNITMDLGSSNYKVSELVKQFCDTTFRRSALYVCITAIIVFIFYLYIDYKKEELSKGTIMNLLMVLVYGWIVLGAYLLSVVYL